MVPWLAFVMLSYARMGNSSRLILEHDAIRELSLELSQPVFFCDGASSDNSASTFDADVHLSEIEMAKVQKPGRTETTAVWRFLGQTMKTGVQAV